MVFEQKLEEGQSYASPTELLQQVKNQLPEDEEYWFENSTGGKQTFESLEELEDHLTEVEEEWDRFREFIPLESSSNLIDYRESDEAEYLDVEFPYMNLDNDYRVSVTQRVGALDFGFMKQKKEKAPKISSD